MSSDSSDILVRLCGSCVEGRQKTCAKTGRGGSCDRCVRLHKACNLKDEVKAYWTATGDPRGRSRSRSLGPSQICFCPTLDHSDWVFTEEPRRRSGSVSSRPPKDTGRSRSSDVGAHSVQRQERLKSDTGRITARGSSIQLRHRRYL